MESDIDEPSLQEMNGKYGNLLWTRVLTPGLEEPQNLEMHSIGHDVRGDEELSKIVDLRAKKKWALLFAPSMLEAAVAQMTLDEEVLVFDSLAEYALIGSRLI